MNHASADRRWRRRNAPIGGSADHVDDAEDYVWRRVDGTPVNFFSAFRMPSDAQAQLQYTRRIRPGDVAAGGTATMGAGDHVHQKADSALLAAA